VLPNRFVCISCLAAVGLASLVGCGSMSRFSGATPQAAALIAKDASTNPKATFQGCWYGLKGKHYQGVEVSVANPGTYSFDADLYYGTTCDPSTQADEFGFGQKLPFGGEDYIFWFTAFADKRDMSALWHVGSDTSQCVNYETALQCD
jgi:hypothetical protein